MSVSLIKDALLAVEVVDLEVAAEATGPASRLEAVLRALPELRDSDSVAPVQKQLEAASDHAVSWFAAWDLLVKYRNQTLGHPEPAVIGSTGFYEALTPVLGEVVEAMVCNPAVEGAFRTYPLARWSRSEPDRRSQVIYRLADGYEAKVVIDEPEGPELRDERTFYLQLHADGPRFRAYRWRKASALERRLRPELESASVPLADVAVQGPAGPDLPHELVLVEPGAFWPSGTRDEDAGEVTVEHRFAIGRWPVTQQLFAEVLGERPSQFVGETHPVESVSWFDALRFCNALSERELLPAYDSVKERGQHEVEAGSDGYRLPTEAEWSYACLGGATGVGFPDLDLAAWFKDNAGGSTRPVGAKAANGLGLHDMIGNVWEWCQDSFQYPARPGVARAEPASGGNRVRRGGSWNDVRSVVSDDCRTGQYPAQKNRFTGFRIVRPVTTTATRTGVNAHA